MDVELFTANTGIIPNNSTNSTTTTVTTSSPNDGKSFKQDLNENPDLHCTHILITNGKDNKYQNKSRYYRIIEIATILFFDCK